MLKKAWPVVLLAGVLAACGIPDLKPFSDATTEMATVLKQGFEKTRTTLSAAAESAEKQDEFKAKLTQLDKQWEPTRKALSSLVAYSDSLAAVAESGRNSKETMAKVTGALSDLASSVGALPVNGALDIVGKVGAKIIEMQAAHDIRKAVNQAAEAVDLMAPILRDNFAELRTIHNAAAAAWESRVLGRWSFERNYYDSLIAEQQRLEYLLTLIIGYQSAPASLTWRAALATAKGNQDLASRLLGSVAQEQAELLAALRKADPVFAKMMAAEVSTAELVEKRQTQLIEQIGSQRKEIAMVEPAYRQSSADLAAVQDARTSGNLVLQRATEAIGAWQKAHRSLQAAAEGKQSRPSVAELLSIVGEITALLK
jgi:hypothetical protein